MTSSKQTLTHVATITMAGLFIAGCIMAVYSGPYAITRFIVNFCGLHALTESDLATFEAALLVLFVPLSVLVCYLWFALTSWFKERGLLAKEPSDQEGHQ